jgi:hypothetical protein
MKFVLLMSLFVSSSAFAAAHPLCVGNPRMAREAIKSSAASRFGGPCLIVDFKKTTHWPSEGRESYGAEVQCPNTPMRRYSASIKKENAVCSLKFVRLLPMSGSQCGLTDIWGGETNDDGDAVGEQWRFDESAEISIGDLTPAKMRALPAMVKKQIIASFDDVVTIEEAVETVKEHSEGGEGYYRQFTFEGREYDAVEYYPGGNAYGKIFKRGSDQPLAVEGDGDISCVE